MKNSGAPAKLSQPSELWVMNGGMTDELFTEKWDQIKSTLSVVSPLFVSTSSIESFPDNSYPPWLGILSQEKGRVFLLESPASLRDQFTIS